MSSKHVVRALAMLLAIVLLPEAHLSLGDASASTRAAGALPVAPSGPRAGGVLFIENAGQWPEAARFQVWGGGQTLWLAEDAVWLTEATGWGVEGSQVEGLKVEERNLQPATAYHLRLSFPGTDPHPVLEPFDRLDTRISYFIGDDPAGWRPDVPVWGGVRYRDLYPGVDLVVGAGPAPALDDGPAPDGRRPQGSPLQWWLETRDGADLSAVRLRIEGADAVAVDGAALRLSTPLGDLTVPLLQTPGLEAPPGPAIVQGQDLQAFTVVAPFVPAHPSARRPAITAPAVHDPQSEASDPAGLVYATFLGGSSDDSSSAIAVDAAGRAYVTGSSLSADFPANSGPGHDPRFDGGYDAFVVQLDATGTGLLYATFLGGDDEDYSYDIAVDGAGQVYVTGYTTSSNFAASLGPGYDATYNGNTDAFVVKLDATGTGLLYATYLGGSAGDWSNGIAVDGSGRAYVTGKTASADFPASLGPGYDTSFNGDTACQYVASCGDAFVVALDATGAALPYATFLGGRETDTGTGITVDSAGAAYVTGATTSANFPTGPGYRTSHACSEGYEPNPYVVKLAPSGAALSYATYLGGCSIYPTAIAVDGAGAAYVATNEMIEDPYQIYHNHGRVWKLAPDGMALPFVVAIDDGRESSATDVAVDGLGAAYATGTTWVWGDDGPYDAMVVKLDAADGALHRTSYIAGTANDYGTGIVVDRAGQAYVTGYTTSEDLLSGRVPGYDSTYNGDGDTFVFKLDTTLTFAIPQAGARPTIDGNLWEWGALPALHLDRTTASSITGAEPDPTPAGLSADLQSAWRPGVLYFAAAVSDDVLVGSQSANVWHDDAIELSIYLPDTGGTHQFTIGLDGRQTHNGNPITSLFAVTGTVPGGWTLETVIPAWVLGLDALAGGEQYRFTFAVWDDDTFGWPAQTHMIWRGTATDVYEPGWGTLSLSSTLYDFPQPGTPTPTAIPTATPMATLTATPTATLTATPTAILTATPTATSSDAPLRRLYLPLVLRG